MKFWNEEPIKRTMYICHFEGIVEKYALMWLNLTNNARENKDILCKVSNNSKNDVFVIGNSKEADIKGYLESLGLTIKEEYEVNWVDVMVEYETDELEALYEFSSIE